MTANHSDETEPAAAPARIVVREARHADYSFIRETVLSAFGQATEADLVEALRQSNDVVLELVAEVDEDIVGHILISALVTPRRCVALAPVSVRPPNQGRGIGSSLIRTAIEKMHRDGWRAMFLLGEPGYYSRFGFSVEACAKFGSNYPQEYTMVLELADGALDRLSGRIAYAAPFASA